MHYDCIGPGRRPFLLPELQGTPHYQFVWMRVKLGTLLTSGMSQNFRVEQSFESSQHKTVFFFFFFFGGGGVYSAHLIKMTDFRITWKKYIGQSTGVGSKIAMYVLYCQFFKTEGFWTSLIDLTSKSFIGVGSYGWTCRQIDILMPPTDMCLKIKGSLLCF